MNTYLLNQGWEYVESGLQNPLLVNLLQGWKKTDLPHDYAVEKGRDERSPAGLDEGFFQGAGLYYKKTFHITLVGCSQGGFVSALAAAERESEIERLIMYYPALCIPDDARRGQMITAKFDPAHVPNQFRALFVRLSSKYVLDVIGMDPFRAICGFQKPVLIVHGTKDKLVDVSYSRRACEGYRNCWLVEVNGDHGFILSGFATGKRATLEYLRSNH